MTGRSLVDLREGVAKTGLSTVACSSARGTRRYVLLHSFLEQSDGARFRVRMVNQALAGNLGCCSTEVIVVSARFAFGGLASRLGAPLCADRLIVPALWTNHHWRARLFNAFSVSCIGLSLAVYLRPDYVVAENSLVFPLAQRMKYFRPATKLIVDLHGALPEEAACLYQGSPDQKRIVERERHLEQAILKTADLLICPSEELIRRLRCKCAHVPVPMHALACGVDTRLFRFDPEARQQIRSEFGLGDEDVLFVQATSLARWQRLEYAVRLFDAWSRLRAAPRAHFLILSFQRPDALIEAFSRAGGTGLSHRTVPHDQVPAYLSAADMGFLLRDDDVVNRVASPTKLGEYLACGLPVIAAPVARYWPPAQQDPGCLCWIEGREPEADVLQIRQFLAQWRADLASNRARAARLAERTLCQARELERLQQFLQTHLRLAS